MEDIPVVQVSEEAMEVVDIPVEVMETTLVSYTPVFCVNSCLYLLKFLHGFIASTTKEHHNTVIYTCKQ
jgi:hypothetical protein